MISVAVTPFIIKHCNEHPAVYVLALLPAYDAGTSEDAGALAEVVLVGAEIGTGLGISAAKRHSPLILSRPRGGFEAAFIHRLK